jgi:hypothetical protein
MTMARPVGTIHDRCHSPGGLMLLVNHLKSQMGAGSAKTEGTKLRKQQAERVAAIARSVRTRKRLPVILGDLNADWNETKKKPDGTTEPTEEAQSLGPIRQLVTDGVLVDPFPVSPRPWTHYYVPFDSVRRLDYVLLDPLLATDAKAGYERRGLTRKCNADKDEQPGERRYPAIGYVGTEASDHCLVSVDVTLPPRSKIDDALCGSGP